MAGTASFDDLELLQGLQALLQALQIEMDVLAGLGLWPEGRKVS